MMNTEIFNINTSLAPRRKIRGKKRYYRKLRENADKFRLIENADHLFNLWHCHIDSKSISSLGWKHRKAHLDSLFIIYNQLVAETKILKNPFQLWLIVHEKNGYDDSVYLHTPNPHTEFPCILRNVKWGKKHIEQYFQEYLAPHEIRVGVSYNEDQGQKVYYIYSPTVGEPPEEVECLTR